MCSICEEWTGTACPVCGDLMDKNSTNYQPVWSDKHDNIVCRDCAETSHTFTPSASATSDSTPLVAGPCTVLRALTPGIDYDAEVGPMYRIVQANGVEVSAFADEITRETTDV